MISKPPEQAHAESRVNVWAMVMFVVLLASYVINAMDRQIFPILVANVRDEYGFSLANAGLLSTVFTLGMGLAAIPAGYMLSRMSRKLTIQLGILLFSATTPYGREAGECVGRRSTATELYSASMLRKPVAHPGNLRTYKCLQIVVMVGIWWTLSLPLLLAGLPAFVW